MSDSVLVNGSRLKKDRIAVGHTQASFAMACGSVTIYSVRRAERSQKVIRSSVRRMAETLGQPVERYLAENREVEPTSKTLNARGVWTGYYVEADRGIPPCVIELAATFSTEDGIVAGKFCSTRDNETLFEDLQHIKIEADVVSGLSEVNGWLLPHGRGALILKALRDMDWLEGFHSWMDPDSSVIETSRLILVRRTSPNYSVYCKRAHEIITEEVETYKLRKAKECGFEMPKF